jgi:hypothetical protein
MRFPASKCNGEIGSAFTHHVMNIVFVGAFKKMTGIETCANIAAMKAERRWPMSIGKEESDSVDSSSNPRTIVSGKGQLSVTILISKVRPQQASIVSPMAGDHSADYSEAVSSMLDAIHFCSLIAGLDSGRLAAQTATAL